MNHNIGLGILVATLVLTGYSCSGDKGDGSSLTITKNNRTSYSIAYNEEFSRTACENLAEAFKDLTGAKPSLYQSGSKTGRHEIQVGATDRIETREAIAKAGANGYVIAATDGKLVIAGTDVVWTSLAIKEFETRVLKNPLFMKDGKLTLPADYSYVQSFEDPQLIARLVGAGVEFTLNPTLVLNCPGDDGMVIAQGAASDGKCFYFLTRSVDDGNSKVYKYDMKSLSLVRTSEMFDAGHANDATFDHGKNRFIAAHGHDEGKILTPLDPETLEVGKNIDIPVGSGAITYNPGKKSFAISQGGKTLYVADNDFNVLSSYTRTDSAGYLAQGMGCDDYYIYFPMSPQNGLTDNVLVTYDWNGNHVAELHIPMSIESESMFYSDGSYYVNFYAGSRKGAALYRVDPVYSYTYTK